MADGVSPEVKALQYVESLGLNSVYEHALEVRKALEAQQQDLHNIKNRRRELEQFKADVEMEVVEAERAKHPDMSAAAMDKHLKVAFSNHSDLRGVRDEMFLITSQIEAIEMEMDRLHIDLKIDVARLHELGGYFQFMAVLKQVSASRESNPTDSKDPWK